MKKRQDHPVDQAIAYVKKFQPITVDPLRKLLFYVDPDIDPWVVRGEERTAVFLSQRVALDLEHEIEIHVDPDVAPGAIVGNRTTIAAYLKGLLVEIVSIGGMKPERLAAENLLSTL